MIQSVTLAYFSGTGGTARIAYEFEKEFGALGISVNKLKITRFAAPPAVPSDLLVILAPVYAFRLAQVAEDWIGKLPTVQGLPAAVISVSGGGEISPNTACRSVAKSRLKRKGYRVVYEKMFVMPTNFAEQTPKEMIALLFRVLPRKVQSAVRDLAEGKVVLSRPRGADRVFTALGRAEHLGARFFGKGLHASQACNQCGLCVKNCPMGNIRMKDAKLHFGFHCLWCLKCVYSCPTETILPRILKSVAIKSGFDIRKMEEEAAKTVTEPDEKKLKSLLWSGIWEYSQED